MKSRNGRNNAAIFAIMAVVGLFLIILVLFQSRLLDREKRFPVLTLDAGWDIRLNGRNSDIHQLSGLSISGIRDGDAYELSGTLPEEVVPSPALFLPVRQAVIEVVVGGETVYTYGGDLRREGRMLQRGHLVIPLPEGYEGQDVQIRLTATEPGAFNTIGPIEFGDEQEFYQRFIGERRLPLLLGIFLCVYAVFQILWLPYLFFTDRSTISPLFSALITLDLGMYHLGFYDLLELFTQRSAASTLTEYISLYLIPCFFAAYLASLLSGRARQICIYCAGLDGAMVFSIVLLHIMELAHITLFLPIFYVVAFIESILCFLSIRGSIAEMRRNRTGLLEIITDYTVYFGFLIFVIFAFIDAAIYAVTRFFSDTGNVFEIPFMMMGSIIFAMALTAQFFLHGVSHLRADVTRGQLEQRAYTDPLTGLANRIRCEQEMMQLKKDRPFVIISFDLDGLKAVNDSLGHAEGDRMLTGFAGALKKCFGDMTLVGRMGGDEFLVILTGSECAVTDAKLRELDRALLDLNLDEPYFHYSVSYGYAGSHETHFGKRVRDIYMLADRRMYDMKRKRKQEKEAENV